LGRYDPARRRWGVAVVQQVGFLVIAACFLVLLVVGIVVGLMAVHSHYQHKKFVDGQQFDLVKRELDRDPSARPSEVYASFKRIDADLQRGQRGDTNVARHRVTSTSDDSGLPSSEPLLRSLPAVTPPDEQFRKK
jgi:hypothetical protein